jgi:hypothetical protein
VKIEQTTRDHYTIDEKSLRFVPAVDLLVPQRFDITAKTIYAQHKIMNVAVDWAEQLYHSHLFFWNRGDIHEFDGSKNDFNDFKKQFNELLQSISQYGVDPERGTVPLLDNGVIANGSHRVAAGIVMNKKIPVVDVVGPAHNYPASLFQENKTPQTVLDAMNLEYCLRKKSVRIAAVFPMALNKLDQIRDILSQAGTLIAEKDIYFNQNAMANLIHVLYEGELWLQVGQGITRGVLKHIRNRYEPGKAVKFIFIDCVGKEAEILTKTTDVKTKIRNIFNQGNFPIHINDTYAETVSLACQILHPKSLELLTVTDSFMAPDFLFFIHEVKGALAPDEWHDFVIDSGGVMASYGLRDTQDLDYIAPGKIAKLEALPFCSLHDDVLHLYDNAPKELVYDPRNYLYFFGIKIVDPSLLVQMKEKRGEDKDKADVFLLKKIQQKDASLLQRARMIGANIRVYPILIRCTIRARRKKLKRRLRRLFRKN